MRTGPHNPRPSRNLVQIYLVISEPKVAPQRLTQALTELTVLTELTALKELTALTGAYRTQPMVVSVATYFPFFWTSVRRLRPIFSKRRHYRFGRCLMVMLLDSTLYSTRIVSVLNNSCIIALTSKYIDFLVILYLY